MSNKNINVQGVTTPVRSDKLEFVGGQFIQGLSPGFDQPHASLLVFIPNSYSIRSGLAEGIWEKFALSKANARLPELVGPVENQLALFIVAIFKASNMPINAEPTSQDLGEGMFRLQIPVNYNSWTEVNEVCRALISLLGEKQTKSQVIQDAGKLERFLKMISETSISGRNDFGFLAAAKKLGIPWSRFSSTLYQYGQGRKARSFDSTLSDATPMVGVNLVQNKVNTTRILRRLAMPAPDNAVVQSFEQAQQYAETIGYPVVVKPIASNRGYGVTSWIYDADLLRRAFLGAKKISSQVVVVEEFIPGNDYRLHVLDGKCYRVRERIPGSVTGDGVSNIKELLEKVNSDPRRGADTSLTPMVIINLNDEALYMLKQQGLSVDDIPEKGQFVQLRTISNVSKGGESIEVPIPEVHPDNLYLAERAVRAFNLDIAAIDFLCPDIRKSWLEVGGGICEINAAPQFGEGAPEKIFSQAIEGNGRIPTGLIFPGALNNIDFSQVGKLLAERNKNLGAYINSELWIGSHRVAKELDEKSFEGGTILLKDREVDAVLLQTDDSFDSNGYPSLPLDYLIVDETTVNGPDLEQLKNLVAVTNNIFVAGSEETATKIRKALKGVAGKVDSSDYVSCIDVTSFVDYLDSY